VDHFFIIFDKIKLVEYVPAQGFEERIKEFLAQLDLVIFVGMVESALFVEAFYELLDTVRCGHWASL
jgi:hypothetical protein